MLSESDRGFLLDATRSEVKRWGGSTPSLTHLAAALERLWSEDFTSAFTPADREQLARHRSGGRFIGTEEDVTAVLAATSKTAVLHSLRERLLAPVGAEPASGGPTPTPPVPAAPTPATPTTSLSELPEPASSASEGAVAPGTGPGSWHKRSAALVEVWPGEWPGGLLGRATEVTDLVVALTRTYPVPVLVTGHPGSGRTSTLRHVAGLLAERGIRTVRVLAEKLGPDPAQALHWIIEDGLESTGEGDLVLVVDDVETLVALGTSAPDVGAMRLLAWASTRPHLRLVLVCDERYAARLGTHVEHLMARASLVPMTELTPAQVREVVIHRLSGEFGEGAHRTLAPHVEGALLPRGGSDLLAHPGLALSRLDLAFSRGSHFGDVDADEPLAGNPARSLAERLSGRVKGQDQAITAVARRMALTLAKLDLRPGRPDGVFLFVGPTGVGKTELARAMADALFGSVDSLIRLDMSEFAHDWAISRLTGPMPGYVGSTEPDAWLTTRIVRTPRTVVLLDEIEKAHPRVWNVFLQAFDAGRLTDSRGVVADLSEVVFVMTSNLGVREAQRGQLGFGSSHHGVTVVEEKIRSAIAETLPPEFVGRLDEVVVFNPLSLESILDIAHLEVSQAVERLRTSGWDVTIDADVRTFLAETGYEPAMGARHLLRNIERHLLGALAQADFRQGRVLVRDGQLVFVGQ